MKEKPSHCHRHCLQAERLSTSHYSDIFPEPAYYFALKPILVSSLGPPIVVGRESTRAMSHVSL